MNHALPNVELGISPGSGQALGVAASIVEQYFVLADVQADRRETGQVAEYR